MTSCTWRIRVPGTWYYEPGSDSMVSGHKPFVDYLSRTFEKYGLDGRWTFVAHTGEQYGVTGQRLQAFLGSAELFLNVTGAGVLKDAYRKIPNRAFLDTDPGFIQFRLAKGIRRDKEHVERHTTHFSFGCNIGPPECTIPTLGVRWRPTVQPICLSLWPELPAPADGHYTTVLKWQSYDTFEFEGEEYGLKEPEMIRFLDLPQRTGERLELSIAGHPPADELRASGWILRDGLEVSGSVEDYQSYISGSKAEWSVAKQAYVKTNSGWFSERSACYLASGRPVILQETGYSNWMRTGKGVIPFTNLEEAGAALEDVSTRYPEHCAAARELGHEYFSADKVLRTLIRQAVEADSALLPEAEAPTRSEEA